MKKLSNTPQRSKDPSGIMASAIIASALLLLSVARASAQLPVEINLSLGEADTIVRGAANNDELTRHKGIAIGDINGDGIDDLAIVSQGADGPPNDVRADAGAVYVFFGSSSLPGDVDLATESADVTIYGPTAFSGLGAVRAIAVGDINGDGIGDLILGAYSSDGPSGNVRLDSGMIFVIYGRSTFPSEFDLANTGGLKGLDGADLFIQGADADDIIGTDGTILVGDVNDDGVGDLVFAAPSGDSLDNDRVDAGEVYVIYGSSSLPSSIDLNDPAGSGGPDVRIYGTTVGGKLGTNGALVLGDTNGDGILDILVGEPFADSPPGLPGPAVAARGPAPARASSGAAFVVFGSGTLPSSVDLRTDADVEIFGASAGDNVTESGALAVGDVNGDGADDIVLGSSRADGPFYNRPDVGEAYIIYGGAGLAPLVDLYIDPGNPKGGFASPDVVIFGTVKEDRLTAGGAVLVGDFNGDGFDDVALGADATFAHQDLSREGAGAAYLIFGGDSIAEILYAYAAYLIAAHLGLTPDVVIHGEFGHDYLTAAGAMAAGDVNGDGTMDLILGAAGNDIVEAKGSPGTNEGVAFIIYGGSGLSSDFDLYEGDADVRIQGSDPQDRLTEGGNVFSADVTGDGVDDVLLGASNANAEAKGRSGAGEAYIINGQTVAPSATVIKTDAPDNPLPRDYGTARATVDYLTGAFSSFTTVVLTRSSKGISNLADTAKIAGDEILDVFWEIQTNRLGFGEPQFSLQYTDAEAAGFDEDAITALHSPSLSGPWSVVTGQSLDTRRNTVSFSTDLFGFFALVADATVPSVTIEKGVNQNDPAMMLPVVFDVVFSEAVTGFEASDVVFSGTAGSPIAEVSEVTANAYTVSITSVRSEGTLIVSIPADAAIDTVGNPSTASTSTNNTVTLEGDFTPPTVTVEQGMDQEDPAPVPIVFDVTFSEDVTGFDATDVVIGGTATGAVATVTVVDGANYTIEITEVATFGTVTVSLDAGAATDLAAAANPSDASTSMDNTVTIEEDMGCSLSPGSGGGAGTPSSDFALMVFAGLMLAAFGRRKRADTAVR